MAEKLFDEFGDQVEALTLIPSVGGVFEVEVDGTLVFSKKEMHRHANFDEVRHAIQAL